MNSKVATKNHNIKVLLDLGFQKVKNTTMFRNGDRFILSPGVSRGTNKKYWFDIREVNLKYMRDSESSHDVMLLVRIVPDLFIFENLKLLSPLLSEQLKDNRPNSGNVWGIHIDIALPVFAKEVFLFNVKCPRNRIATILLDKAQTARSIRAC